MTQIGSRAKQLRLERGETQEAVARRAGLNLNTYVRIELGYHEPTLKSLIRIAEAFGITLDELTSDEPVAS